MKKVIFCAMVLFLALTASVFADRVAIDDTIKAYEAVIVEAESLAAMQLIAPSDFSALEGKAEAVGPALQGIENEREWTIQDTKALAELNVRFNAAMTAIAKIIIKY